MEGKNYEDLFQKKQENSIFRLSDHRIVTCTKRQFGMGGRLFNKTISQFDAPTESTNGCVSPSRNVSDYVSSDQFLKGDCW